MRLQDPHCPIARQFVVSPQEQVVHPEERDDPIGDLTHSPVKGLIHRYADRVLLTPSLECPVHCRFCFRRVRMGREKDPLTAEECAQALHYIAAHPSIWEVILSGGDPLFLPLPRLRFILDALDEVPHVGMLRIHSRVPVVLPAHIDRELLSALTCKKPLTLVIHCNHPRELSTEVRQAIGKLVQRGILLLSQSVLLKGVNDDVATLEHLFRTLSTLRIKPYYLHHCDLVPGTGHFRTTLKEGMALMRALRPRLSGPCQPAYVLDSPGGGGKIPVMEIPATANVP